MNAVTRKLFLYFPQSMTETPIVYRLVKDFGLEVNIYRAKVTPDEYGYLVLDVTGEGGNIDEAIHFVETYNVQISETDKGLTWDEEKCTSCGNCLTHCPTDALHVTDGESRRVVFDADLCVDCLSCIKNCPFGACSSVFEESD